MSNAAFIAIYTLSCNESAVSGVSLLVSVDKKIITCIAVMFMLLAHIDVTGIDVVSLTVHDIRDRLQNNSIVIIYRR